MDVIHVMIHHQIFYNLILCAWCLDFFLLSSCWVWIHAVSVCIDSFWYLIVLISITRILLCLLFLVLLSFVVPYFVDFFETIINLPCPFLQLVRPLFWVKSICLLFQPRSIVTSYCISRPYHCQQTSPSLFWGLCLTQLGLGLGTRYSLTPER